MAELAFEDLEGWRGFGGAIRKAQAEATLCQAGEWVRTTWARAVSGGPTLPGMTRPVYAPQYARAIQHAPLYRIEQQGRRLVLRFQAPAEVFPQYLRWEEPRRAYDLKPGLLRGEHRRLTTAGSPYTIVPLRHRTPGGGLPGGVQNVGGYASVLPWSVYRALQRLQEQGGSRLEGAPWEALGGRPAYGQQSKPAPLQGLGQTLVDAMSGRLLGPASAASEAAGAPGPTSGGYTWQTGPYAGLQKSRYGPGYVTFRTVSQRSDPRSWIVPYRGANPITQALAQYAKQQVPGLHGRL